MKNLLLSLVVLVGLTNTACVSAQKKTTSSYEIQRAGELLEEGDREGGLAYIEKELQNNPESYEAYELKIYVFQTDGDYGKSIGCADSAIMYFKGKDKDRLGNLYNLRGDAYIVVGDTAKCLKDYRYANKLAPANASFRNDLVFTLLLLDDFEEAKTISLKAVKDFPDDPYAYLNVAQINLKMGEYEKAMEYTDLAEEHNASEYYLAKIRLGIRFETKDYQKAISCAITVLEESQYNTVATYCLCAMADSMLGTVEDSIKKQYLATNDAETASYWKAILARIYMECGEREKALAVMLQIQKDYPGFDQDWLNYFIGRIYHELDMPEPTIYYLSKVIDTDYHVDWEIYEYRGLAYFETGQFEKAEADFRKIIDYNEEYAFWSYYRIGWIKEMRKDFAGAMEDYDNSILLNPDISYVHLMKANILKDYMSKPDEAKVEFEKVISLEREQKIMECSMYAYAALGDNDRAKAVMDSILVADPTPGNYYDATCLSCRMGDKEAGLENLRIALEKGFVNFAHIVLDDDVDLIRNEERFHSMMAGYHKKHEDRLNALGISLEGEPADTLSTDSASAASMYEIPITRRSGDTYDIRASINGIPMNFILDTGCSDISISELECNFLRKNGYISPHDERGYSNYVTANGQSVRCRTLNLKEVKVGDLVLRNVRASVVPNQQSDLLLGQSILSKVGKVEIDNEKSVIRIQR